MKQADFDVVRHRKIADEMENLEEAVDRGAPKAREPTVGSARAVGAVEPKLAIAPAVKKPADMQQRRLVAARRATMATN